MHKVLSLIDSLLKSSDGFDVVSEIDTLRKRSNI